MNTPVHVRFAAFCAAVLITVALVESMALLGHPRPATDAAVAQTVPRPPDDSGTAHAEAAYLPGLYVEEERAAQIDVLPPQF